MKNLKNFLLYTTMVTTLTLSIGVAQNHKAEAQVSPTEVTQVTDRVEQPVVTDGQQKQEAQEQKTFRAVTSYMLNVRRESNAHSFIERTMVNNQVFEASELSNGWLQLSTGGFVNGKYTKIVSEEETNQLNAQPQQIASNEKQTTQQSSEVQVSSAPTGPVQAGIVGKSNATLSDLQVILEGTELQGIEQALLDVENNQNVNAFFTLAVAKLESGNGQSRIARDKNNLFGMNATDNNPYTNAYSYPSKSESIRDFGRRVKAHYIDQGRTTLDSINAKYSSSSNWSAQVNTIMQADSSRVKR